MNSLPNYFNTIIVVITYNPDWGFRDRIKRYVEIADKAIIVDNGSVQDVSQYIPEGLNKHFIIVKSPQNRGIAWGLIKEYKKRKITASYISLLLIRIVYLFEKY